MKTITVKAEVITPTAPNFIKQTDGQLLPIEAISDSGLKLIGEAYTEELIKKAQKKRKIKETENEK